jgi:DNA-binding phage protein
MQEPMKSIVPWSRDTNDIFQATQNCTSLNVNQTHSCRIGRSILTNLIHHGHQDAMHEVNRYLTSVSNKSLLTGSSVVNALGLGLARSKYARVDLLRQSMQCGVTRCQRSPANRCLTSVSNKSLLTRSSVVNALGLGLARSTYARDDLLRPSMQCGVTRCQSSQTHRYLTMSLAVLRHVATLQYHTKCTVP